MLFSAAAQEEAGLCFPTPTGRRCGPVGGQHRHNPGSEDDQPGEQLCCWGCRGAAGEEPKVSAEHKRTCGRFVLGELRAGPAETRQLGSGEAAAGVPPLEAGGASEGLGTHGVIYLSSSWRQQSLCSSRAEGIPETFFCRKLSSRRSAADPPQQ